MQAFRAKLAELGARDYTTAEMLAMLENEDSNSDSEVTSQEYVINACPPQTADTSPAPAPAPEPAPDTQGRVDDCPYANDGECDVPVYCPATSDVADCAELPPPHPPLVLATLTPRLTSLGS
jgi:hypothetical protein